LDKSAEVDLGGLGGSSCEHEVLDVLSTGLSDCSPEKLWFVLDGHITMQQRSMFVLVAVWLARDAGSQSY
jgi:hypothetical protein